MEQSWEQTVEHKLDSYPLSLKQCGVHSLSLKHSLKNHRGKEQSRNTTQKVLVAMVKATIPVSA